MINTILFIELKKMLFDCAELLLVQPPPPRPYFAWPHYPNFRSRTNVREKKIESHDRDLLQILYNYLLSQNKMITFILLPYILLV